MCSWDINSDLIDYVTTEYPDIDIRKSVKKSRKRFYEKFIANIIIEHCCERMFNDPIDIIYSYELVYEHLNSIYKNDIYRFQLNVIRNLSAFLRRREEKYG